MRRPWRAPGETPEPEGGLWVAQGLVTSPHMKSEVKTKFRNGEGPNVFALGLAGRPIKGSFGVRPCRLVGWC